MELQSKEVGGKPMLSENLPKLNVDWKIKMNRNESKVKQNLTTYVRDVETIVNNHW